MGFCRSYSDEGIDVRNPLSHSQSRRPIWLTIAAVAVLVAGACTKETITYRDRAPFNPPPDSVNGFLGYFDVSTKQTTCGNCHVGVQATWVNTKHAHAWEDLQASGHASASCEGCHSVDQNGNFLVDTAGYLLTPDSAYQDVQCENCHGPGLKHVENPDATQPLASIQVDTGLTNGCGECHSGAHDPFVEQWKQSAHGSGPGFAHAATNPSCAPCHEGKTALVAKFDENANYIEKGDSAPIRIVCAVCHNPHGSPYPHQLRAPISEPTTDNLCVRCHSRTGTPPWSPGSPTSTARGAHGAQGLLVIGQNVGWIPPNFQYDTNLIVSSHGTSANPQLCATCHVAQTTVTDKITGAFKFQSVGHLFAAVPCTDSAGLPTTDETCTIDQRDFSACATSGCHGTAGAARAAFITIQTALDAQLDQIWADNNGNGVIDPYPTDGGILPQMVARGTAADSAALDFSNTTVTAAKGTLWNAALAATNDRQYFLSGRVFGIQFSTHMASGNGVHNPFLLQALLAASIQSLNTSYGPFPVPPNPATMRVTATPPPGVHLVNGSTP